MKIVLKSMKYTIHPKILHEVLNLFRYLPIMPTGSYAKMICKFIE